MKKVLIVATIGGFLPVSEINNARLLQELGFQVHYAANMQNKIYEYDEQKLVDMGIVLHHVEFSKNPFRFGKLFQSTKAVQRIIEEQQIEVVHCHTPVGGVAGRLASWMAKKRPKVIYTAHGFHFYKGASLLNWLLYYPVEYLLSNITDCIVTINQEDYKQAQKMCCKHVIQIPGVGIDFKRFHPKKKTACLKQKEGSKKIFRIISIGELNENKNHRTVIEAIASLQDADIVYEIYGNGPLKEELQKLIKKLKLETQVFLREFEIEIENKIIDADSCIFPSFREGLGLAGLEAMACGIPLIASDNRGTREYMQHDINGIICRPDDVTGFAKAILRIKNDKAFAERIAEEGLQTVKKFSVEESTNIMRRLYETL